MKKLSLFAMSTLYIIAGSNHFISPEFYMKIMPPYIPWHTQIVYASGAIEILLGTLLIPLSTRKIAAWGIIVLLIAIFPANINMMLNYLHQKNSELWITILRLPLQLILIWWAYTFTKAA